MNPAGLRVGPFTEEHDRFREEFRAYVAQELAPYAREWEKAGKFPRDVFRKMGAKGYLGLRFPQEVGGRGGDYWFTVCYAEELVRSHFSGLSLSLMIQSDMATPVIHEVGTSEQIEEFLKPAIRGETIAAVGVTERGAGSDLTRIQTSARKVSGDYVINGSKMFITNGTYADFITLAVRTGGDPIGGISLFLFPTDTRGFRVVQELKLIGNRGSGTAELSFDNCRIPKRFLLGRENRGFEYIMKHFQGERLIAAVNAVARGQQAVDTAIRYGQRRKAFNQPIARFQVWRHTFADLYTQLEAARRLTYHACEMFDRGVSAIMEISMAKLFACETCCKIMDRCLQFHGGYGYLDEFSVSRDWRDARLMPIGFGTSEIMRELISNRLGLNAAGRDDSLPPHESGDREEFTRDGRKQKNTFV